MNRLMLASLIGLNTLAIAIPAHADEGIFVGSSSQVVEVDLECRGGEVQQFRYQNVEVTGKLVYVIRHWQTHELIMICDKMPQAVSRGWSIGYGVTVGGKTIDVEFSSEKLRLLADKLAAKQVKINGRDAADKILGDRLAPLPAEAQDTNVLVRGFLNFDVLERFPPIYNFEIRADGKTYSLNFASADLRKLAESLSGRRVFLTGTLIDNTITVRELKADDTASATENVVLRGKLNWHDPHPEQPHFAIDPPLHGVWQLETEGRTFTLSLTRGQVFEAWMTGGGDVRITGTMENGTVRVSRIEKVEPAVQWTIDLRGVLVYMNVAPGLEFAKPFGEGLGERFPVAMQWMICANGKTYTLRFASADLEALAKKLIDKPVIIHGDFDGSFVTVRKIEADETTQIDKTVKIEVIGTLRQAVRPLKGLALEVPNPGHIAWIVEVNGKLYDLNLPIRFTKVAGQFENQIVSIRGKLKDGAIDVEDLVPMAELIRLAE